MKQQRKLILILAVVMSIAIAAGSTMAYLQDTDEDVNVMTLGSVYIEQLELERIVQSDDNTQDTNLKYFEKDKPLYPYVGELAWAVNDEGDRVYQQWPNGNGKSALFTDQVSNVVDKFVFVQNVGQSDAYVRTWFAFEQGDLTEQRFEELIGQNINMNHWEWKTIASNVEIDGGKYLIKLATYLGNAGDNGDEHPEGVLPAGETTRPSLLQVYLDNSAGNADVEALDSNGDGKYNILVVSQGIQAAGFEDAKTALNAGFTANHPFGDMDVDEEITPNSWENYADTSWYNEDDDVFVLMTAEELAGLAKLVDEGTTFEGKTVQLGRDLDMAYIGENGEPVCFDPIGSYRNDAAFKGTFDGRGHTIANMSQNTWALNNGYYYGDLGLGLFGLVEDATIKNLAMDGASISGESAICGTVAACAYGDMVFENIKVTNSQVNDYQYYAGGIVGWASGDHQYTNCVVDETTVVGGQWGDFGNANGGLIGGAGTSGTYSFKDCTVAARIDAVNDVVSAYQWYNYRNSGMLIGRTGHTETDEAVTTVAAPNVTCENVTVIYGEWANYHYCKFAGTGYPYVRVEAGVSVDAYSNVRYGHPTDANGNTVVDDNHVHNEGEDHNILVAFDQLFGGPADQRYCHYGKATHDGVTVVYNNK